MLLRPDHALKLSDGPGAPPSNYNTERPHSSLADHSPLREHAGGDFIPNPDRLVQFAY
jgi:hypothetical protein